MSNWTVPPQRLDTEQNEFLNNHLYDGNNYWISGFPGSGKSTLLMHATRLIKKDHPNASILFIVYTKSLIEMFKAGFSESGVSGINFNTMYRFMNSQKNYDYIFCDEVQDLPASILSAMHQHTGHLFVAGDPSQSIYKTDVRYREETVTPTQILSLINGKEYKLNIVHRLSPSIQNAIQKFIPSMKKLANLRNMANHTTQIRICKANSPIQEIQYIWNEAQKESRVGETCAILFPNKKKVYSFVTNILQINHKPSWKMTTDSWGNPDFDDMNSYLSRNAINLEYVGNGYGNFSDQNKVYLMTYFSAKGLDFDNVFLSGVNQNLYICGDADLSRSIFMVAMTRSRNNLYVCYSGCEHNYLNCFSSDCALINIDQALNPAAVTQVLGF